MTVIAVLGCGNMAQAIVKGFHQKNKEVKFLTYTPSFTRAETLAKDVGGEPLRDLSRVAESDSVLLACKPQQLNDLIQKLDAADVVLKDKHVISILAATSVATLQKKLKTDRVSRVMPNTPSMIGLGMSLLLHSQEVNIQEKKLVDNFFKACGETATMPSEDVFDRVTTVSGSGPAYVYLFAQGMIEKCQSWGLDEPTAKRLVIQLFRGSSELMKEQASESLDELIAKVTSKGGVTIEAVKKYRELELSDHTSKALDAAFARSKEIAQSFES